MPKLEKGMVEVRGECKDLTCRKPFVRTSKLGGAVPVYCQKCELK